MSRVTREIGQSAGGGWAAGSGFFGSLMAGLFLGMGADYLFDTDPIWTVIGIIAGSISGFYTMWNLMIKDSDD